MRYARRVPAPSRLDKALALALASILAAALACQRAPAPDADPSAKTASTGAVPTAKGGASGAEPYVRPTPSAPYSEAKLRPSECAKAAPERVAVESGCEKCAPDEHCKRVDLRGRVFGVCAKSTCEKDSDCPGQLCACGPPNECVPGNCRGPEDCGGRECAPDRWRYGHGRGVYCRTDRDECATHAHCGPGRECAYVGGRWACRTEIPAPPPG